MPNIKYSVGKNAMNRLLDTGFIQRLINQVLKDKIWHKPLIFDGKCGPDTINAIRNYQSRVLNFMHADGVIEPNRITFNALIKALPKNDVDAHWNISVKKFQPIGMITTGGRISSKQPLPEQLIPTTATAPALNIQGYVFPLDFIPNADYHKGGHARYFGALRSGGARLHAGCDLLAPVGSPVYAMADGEVLGNPSYFYESTYSVTIRHGKSILRYGELLAFNANDVRSDILPNVKDGAKVKKGDVVGYVGRLTSGSSMLHFEYYSGTSTGPLSNRTSPTLYKRRSDLVNPTTILDKAKSNIPTAAERPAQITIDKAISIGRNERKKRNF